MFDIPESLPIPTTDIILSKISDYQIFKHYFPEYEPGSGAVSSPLRNNDDIPSFNIFYSRTSNMLLFKDFATRDRGDCFVFVSKLFNISYVESLYKICVDFGIKDVYIPKGYKTVEKPIVDRLDVDYSTINKIISIRVKVKEYTKEELDWWKSFGISYSTLKKYNVFSLEKVFINSYIIYPKFSFGYLEFKDGIYTWKIYSPLEEKNKKWINNCNSKILQGWTQMPEKGDILILEKALKDSMTIDENWGYPTCSLQNEGVNINPPVLKELKERFKTIYYLGDNDNPGIDFSNNLCKDTGIIPIFIPDKNYKNISDLYKEKGKEFSGSVLNNLIKNANNI